jgi:CHAD domain-containing protein
MSYRLRSDEPLADGIRRIARERIDNAIAELAPSDRDPAERVHNARKQIKKVRAVLRLVREEIGDDIYSKENARLRDAARKLSEVRDSAAIVEALDALLGWAGDRAGREALRAVRERTAAIQQERMGGGSEFDALFTSVSAMLVDARRRAGRWPVERNDFRALRGGLLGTYRAGRELFAESLDDPTPETLHEWRKDVKYLWYQIRLLRPIWPEALRSMSRELKGLSEYLGDYHDLFTLRSLLLVRPDLAADDESREQCLALIDARRAELEELAFAHGARFFAEQPKAFVRRMMSYWKIWARAEREDARHRED